ncbi:MAG: hypothetical protein IJ091_01175 [Oscillospiraceae bacterium]|nr:hypothetical protein [Oscillospiraceae bacterium]
MAKLLNLATLAAAAAGAAYYLEKKGILKVTNKVGEDGSREIGLKIETPEKPLTDTVKEDLKTAADRVTEKANELVTTAKGKFDELTEESSEIEAEVQEVVEDVKEAVEEKAEDISKDIDELLKELDDEDLGL